MTCAHLWDDLCTPTPQNTPKFFEIIEEKSVFKFSPYKLTYKTPIVVRRVRAREGCG